MYMFFNLIYYLLEIYKYLIFIFVIMGYFYDLRQTQFYQLIAKLVDPFLRIFRFATIARIDFSPIVAFILIQFIQMMISEIYFI